MSNQFFDNIRARYESLYYSLEPISKDVGYVVLGLLWMTAIFPFVVIEQLLLALRGDKQNVQ